MRLRVNQFDPVPKRIENVAATSAGNVAIFPEIYSGCLQGCRKPLVVCTTQRRMRFLRGTEVRFNPKMNLHGPAGEPASPALRQLRGLRNFLHPEQIAIKRARVIFPARGHGKLHVIDRRERILRHPALIAHYFRC